MRLMQELLQQVIAEQVVQLNPSPQIRWSSREECCV